MDTDPTSARGAPASRIPRRPRLELLETCWCVIGVTGTTVICDIYGVEGPGVEVRTAYSRDGAHRTQRVADVETARKLAAEWRLDVLARGFTDLPS
jgi:hypothetical protein